MYNSDREEVEVQSCRVAREQDGCISSQKDIDNKGFQGLGQNKSWLDGQTLKM